MVPICIPTLPIVFVQHATSGADLTIHGKNQIVLANNLVTMVADYPSHDNSKNAVLVKYLMGRW